MSAFPNPHDDLPIEPEDLLNDQVTAADYSELNELLGLNTLPLWLDRLVCAPLAHWQHASRAFSNQAPSRLVIRLPLIDITIADLSLLATELHLVLTLRTDDAWFSVLPPTDAPPTERAGHLLVHLDNLDDTADLVCCLPQPCEGLRIVELLIQRDDEPPSANWRNVLCVNWRSSEKAVRSRLLSVLWRGLLRELAYTGEADWEEELERVLSEADVDTLLPLLQWYAVALLEHGSWLDACALLSDCCVAGVEKRPCGRPETAKELAQALLDRAEFALEYKLTWTRECYILEVPLPGSTALVRAELTIEPIGALAYPVLPLLEPEVSTAVLLRLLFPLPQAGRARDELAVRMNRWNTMPTGMSASVYSRPGGDPMLSLVAAISLDHGWRDLSEPLWWMERLMQYAMVLLLTEQGGL